MNIAVIPARGGSKRIPRKNIKSFCGKPIIAWSIAAAHESGCFDHVIVSTDDEEIAQVAREAGAAVPFMRPASLSDDYVGTIPVVRHAIEQLEFNGTSASNVCCIYATAPFIRAQDIRRGAELLDQSGSAFAFSVARYSYPIQRSIHLDATGHVSMLFPEHFRTRSQDLPETYHDAGQFYWGIASGWKESDSIFGPDAVAVVLPARRVQDIDTPEDWSRAEWMFKALQAEAHD